VAAKALHPLSERSMTSFGISQRPTKPATIPRMIAPTMSPLASPAIGRS
jgi:hypothetical protein